MTPIITVGSKAVDPAIQQIFDDMLAFMGDEYTAMNCFANKSASTVNMGISATDKAGDTFTYSEMITGPRISIAPAGATVSAGGTQQFTAAITNADGNPAVGLTPVWSVAGSAGGTVSATGLYAAPASLASAASDLVTAAVSGSSNPASTATVTVNVNP